MNFTLYPNNNFSYLKAERLILFQNEYIFLINLYN